MDTKLTELMDKLSAPFNVDVIEWKPGATSGERALALAYADSRVYQDRLNAVAGADWSDDYQVLDGGRVVLCRLTVAGVTRSDIGEAEANDRNTATSALAQAFKRACSKFGVGRYMYDLPRVWVGYDPQKKRFTKAGEGQLRQMLEGRQPTHKGNGDNGNAKTTKANVTATDFWTLANEHNVDKATAQGLVNGQDWAGAMDRLRELIG